jgi:REP element-mobilizing transposase RayT
VESAPQAYRLKASNAASPISTFSGTIPSFTMDEYESLSHSKWDCKYHIVFIPKCRRKTLYGELKPHLGEIFRRLALQKESRVEEGHLMPDHVHMMISIPPKYAVSQVVGFIGAKARSIWPVSMGRGSAILSGSTFGPEGILSPPSGGTRR